MLPSLEFPELLIVVVILTPNAALVASAYKVLKS